jgi:hypothetical protein
MPEILLFVFATHLPFFVWKYYRTRELRFAATSITFLSLAISYSVRIFAPEWTWAGHPVHVTIRVVSWLFAAVSIWLIARHLVGRIASQRHRTS